VADFAAAILAKAVIMLVESLVNYLMRTAFTAAFTPSSETAAAF
jgi:hypothetical protein